MKITKINNSVCRLIITLLTLIIVIAGGTFAWFTYQSNKSALVLSIGDINNSKIKIKPYQIKETLIPSNTYNDDVYSQITVNNNNSDKMSVNLYYKINQLDEIVINNGLRYTIASSNTLDGEYIEVTTGDFTTIENNRLTILETEIEPTTTIYYRIYPWIDTNTGNQITIQSSVINIELNGNGAYDPDAGIDLKYNITNLTNNSNTLDNGFYTLSNYTCKNNTTLTYNTNSKTLKSSGIDKCDLQFTKTSNPKLYDVVEIGDYIAYTGNNGCDGIHCSGFNANQLETETGELDTYGYCLDENYKFYTYGWRVLYKEDNSVYIVSAGAPECIEATYSASNPTIVGLNTAALKYCNSKYLSNGICNITSAHALNGDDFYKFTSQYYGEENARYLYNYNDGGTYGEPYCHLKCSTKNCGYSNDVIDNGGLYRFGSFYVIYYDLGLDDIIYVEASTLYWDSPARLISDTSNSADAYGFRPVLKLDSSILTTGGMGTINDPYTISERTAH